MKRILITAILTFAFTAFAIHAVESTVFTAEGIIESTAGGVKFPDGSVQASAAFPASSQCIAITSVPTIITVEGVYCLTGHLNTSITTGNAVKIEVDNVTINMNGWKLDGLGAGTGADTVGIAAFNQKNITIHNGTVRGFHVGIQLIGGSNPFNFSRGHHIENVRVVKSGGRGIWIEANSGIVRRNQVLDTGGSTFPGSGYAFGIQLSGPGGQILDNRITNTQASASQARAIFLRYADGAVIEGNHIDNVSSTIVDNSFGIDIVDSPDVIVRGNSLTLMDLGMNYRTGSTGKYMNNLTNSVATRFTGGISVGANN